ncbi:F-actin capping protein beta subunit [Clavulina sp. PMI_390]|nr:F-actin capping protein beta subunit [Clavulina sp. PMI_390]
MDVIDNMLDLTRRLPPNNIEQNLAALVDLQPEYADDLLGSIDQPLKVRTDAATGKEYLICDYNRDGDSYRSPWSSEYDPPLADGTQPSDKLRKLEIAANEAFDTYREMYFEGGVSSVFLWEQDDGGFAGVVLLKKSLTPSKLASGSWDSIHVFETSERGRTAHYKLTSTIMLHLITTGTNAAAAGSNKEAPPTPIGSVDLSGMMTRQMEQDAPLQEFAGHIANVGRIIEDQEIKMRNLLQEVYFGKTKDVVYDLRSVDSLEKARRQRDLQKELAGLLKK